MDDDKEVFIMMERRHVLSADVTVSGGHEDGYESVLGLHHDMDWQRWQKQCLYRFLIRHAFGFVGPATEARIQAASLADLMTWMQQLRIGALSVRGPVS